MKIEDIAKTLGVSNATVSLAINNKPGISRATREKVMEIVRNSGYIPRTMIKNDQQSNYNKTIRFLICSDPKKEYFESDISTSFFEKLIQGMEKECSRYNYTLIFSSVNYVDFGETIRRYAEENNSIGVVLLATTLTEKEITFASKYIQNLVVVNNLYEFMHANFVIMNNRMGGYDACSYLIKLGHKNIGYVQSKTRITNFDLRKQGFQIAIEKNNLKLKRENIFTVSNDIRLAQEDFSNVLKNHKKPLPSALFCENDYMAVGVVKALKNHGKKIPEDMSIVGFDNVSESTVIQPELTTIHVKKVRMGAIAIQRLLNIINSKEGNEICVNSIINTTLLERKSCKHI